MRPEKCQLFQKEVKFLGHRISHQGVSPDPAKVVAVQEQPPKMVRLVHAFLVFVGYYRHFIEDFSKIAKPLNALLVEMAALRVEGHPLWHGVANVTQPFKS